MGLNTYACDFNIFRIIIKLKKVYFLFDRYVNNIYFIISYLKLIQSCSVSKKLPRLLDMLLFELITFFAKLS